MRVVEINVEGTQQTTHDVHHIHQPSHASYIDVTHVVIGSNHFSNVSMDGIETIALSCQLMLEFAGNAGHATKAVFAGREPTAFPAFTEFVVGRFC